MPVLINILVQDFFSLRGGSIGMPWCACNINSFYLFLSQLFSVAGHGLKLVIFQDRFWVCP